MKDRREEKREENLEKKRREYEENELRKETGEKIGE